MEQAQQKDTQRTETKALRIGLDGQVFALSGIPKEEIALYQKTALELNRDIQEMNKIHFKKNDFLENRIAYTISGINYATRCLQLDKALDTTHIEAVLEDTNKSLDQFIKQEVEDTFWTKSLQQLLQRSTAKRNN